MKDNSNQENNNSNAIANQSAQLQSKGAAITAPSKVKLAPIQMEEDEEPIQGEFATTQLAELEAPLQGKFGTIQKQAIQPANNTGMPDNLKSGIESLSGVDVSDVKVHYNSSKPAQLNAHAYAQGSDIHIAPGQEKHLPHEAWHTVQQKQGRVQPTMQMKENVPVNDDPSLENEADVMGEKAMQFSAMVPKNLEQKNINKSIAQLKEDDDDGMGGMTAIDVFDTEDQQNEEDEVSQVDTSVATDVPLGFDGLDDFDTVEDADKSSGIETFDEMSELNHVYESPDAEKREKSSKTITKEELKDIKNKGANQKINFEGEVTMSARLKGFFGQESTYSKFLKKAAEFNSTEDVPTKQNLLKNDLKPLAREWISRHEAEILKDPSKKDENEIKKLTTINRFLIQTKSNYPEIIDSYKLVSNHLDQFLKKPYDNRLHFQRAHELYLTTQKLVSHYKETYPPGINVMFQSEVKEFGDKENKLIKKDAVSGELQTDLGFKVLNGQVGYNLLKGTFHVSGDVGLEIKGLNLESKVTIEFDPKGNLINVTLANGEATAQAYGQELKVSGFSYSMKKKEFGAESAKLVLNILNTEVKLEAIEFSITKDKGFDYKVLKGSSSDTFDTGHGMKVANPSILYVKGEKYHMQGDLAIDMPDLANAKGKVAVTLDDNKQLSDIKVKNGSANANFLGMELDFKGFTYNHTAGTFSVQKAKGSTNIFDQNVEISAVNLKRTLNGEYDYSELTASTSGFDYEYFSLTNITLSRKKDDKPIDGKAGFKTIGSADYKIKEGALSNDFVSLNSEGTAAIEWNPGGETSYSVTDGTLNFDLFGQKVAAKNFSYNSAKKTLIAKSVSITINAGGINKVLTGEDISISKSGLDFKKLSIDAPGDPIENIPFLKIVPSKYSLVYDEQKGYGVQAQGEAGIKTNGFGLEANGAIKGGLSYHFKSNTPDYYIDGGKLEAKMENPLAKIGELFGGNWSSSRFEISAGIPVFPGISAVFGLYMQYGTLLGQNPLSAILAYDDKTKKLVLDAKLPTFTANIEGGVFGGIQVGSPLLLAIALLLRAAGKFDMSVDLGYRKSYKLNDSPTGDKPKKAKGEGDSAEGLTYSIKGELSIGAYLDLVATALYFFEKRFSLELGKKSLGEFEFTNSKSDEEGKPKLPEGDGLADREQLDKHVAPQKQEEAKGLTINELLDIKQNYRFSSDEKKDVIKMVKKAEIDRATVHEIGMSGTTDASGTVKAIETTDTARSAAQFNDVHFQNVIIFNQFIDNRLDWNSLFEIFTNQKTLDPKKTSEQDLQAVLENVQKLGNSINLASDFVSHYKEKIDALEAFANYEKDSDFMFLIRNLRYKYQILQLLQEFKKNHLHSQYWGDDKIQHAQTVTSGWFLGLGASKYETFTVNYNLLSPWITGSKGIDTNTLVILKRVLATQLKLHQEKTSPKA